MKILTLLFILLSTFLTPIAGLLFFVIAFVLLDTTIGIYTSIKINGLKAFRSTFLFNLPVKLFFYLSTIIMAYSSHLYIFGDGLFGINFFLAKLLCSLFLYIEVKSIDESSMLLGNRSFWIIFKDFLSKMKSLKRDITSLVKGEEEEEK